ncbi:MAG: hypothetical protein HYX78_03225 [Armatimonadetes bacterium]|nr:hypothetical protein [Armatimonadota bacterium]
MKKKVVVVSAMLAVVFFLVSAQAETWDMAADWALEGVDLTGIPFGPNGSWGVYAVKFSPEWSWTQFNRPMHFTSSNPWYSISGIDGWWLGDTSMKRIPMMGKNVGGHAPGFPKSVGSVDFDWPNGRIACHTYADPTGKNTMVTAAWIAPEAMTVSVSGGVWTAAKYHDVANRRIRMRLWIDRAANGIGAADEDIITDYLVPTWTESCESGFQTQNHPASFAKILKDDASKLDGIAVAKGDRICVGLYWDQSATLGGMNGLDFRVSR